MFQQAMGGASGYLQSNGSSRGVTLVRATYGAVGGRENDVTSILLPRFHPGPLDLSVPVNSATL